MRRVPVCIAVAVLALALAGCGGKPNKTPEGTAKAYISLMKAGKWKDAALLWDYSDQTSQNPDFGTAASGQQKLIIGKLADEKAEALKQWETYVSDVKVQSVDTSGDQAHATLEGRITGLDMVKADDEWLITGMQ